MIDFISHLNNSLSAFARNIFYFVMQEPGDKSDMFVISRKACEMRNTKYLSYSKLLWK